jgi:hypothetical protein
LNRSRLRRPALGLVACAAAALVGEGCGNKGAGTVLVVVVTVSGSLPDVSALDVTLDGAAGMSENRYQHDGATPILFPTTFSAQLPPRITGTLTIDVRATNGGGDALAEGRQPFTLRAGASQTVYVRLDCGGAPCSVDGGAPDASGTTDGGAPEAGSICGNGRVDPGETCDTAIPAGAPGACPAPDCDDGVPCTVDRPSGGGCTFVCLHSEITAPAAGDACCPAGATAATDSDCLATCGNGAVDPGETCDTGIPAGTPGACPSGTDCDDGDACTSDLLISAATCAAICVHQAVVTQSGILSDGCCPVGAWSAVDVDCPVACGNGEIEPGETCDPGLPAGSGGCPTSCDDGDPCTIDALTGIACNASCSHTPITSLVSGDGCCPAGGTHATDTDCPAVCGDQQIEPGESCDKGSSGAPACPTRCPAAASACLRITLAGSSADCSAHCETSLVTACSLTSDGCCPAGCTATTDADCSSTCGNGLVEAGRETCDTAIAKGAPGACPTSCNDGNPCTDDVLVGLGTCEAACAFQPITSPRAGDGCCPAGANFTVDPDCAPVCGNGVVESPVESCDTDVAGSCPTGCPPAGACSQVALEGTGCGARCVTHTIDVCANGDRCCPAGCNAHDDDDCPIVCGDGIVDPGERCDRAITAGFPGWCPPTCDDGDACTQDYASGTVLGCSRACSHVPITACRSGDGCCPPGCNAAADSDCGSPCGDGHVGSGETCDPPEACPTSCPDDGDTCTRERLTGDAAHCNVACQHVPITACSGQTADLCCPTGCTHATDIDC